MLLETLTREGIVEETPEAYKDLDMVAGISDNLGIAKGSRIGSIRCNKLSKSFQYLEAMDYNDVDTETDTLDC
ncbi:MAG TPA: hypothetical protein VIR31_06750 [Nitrososphaeraceae archaeon]